MVLNLKIIYRLLLSYALKLYHIYHQNNDSFQILSKYGPNGMGAVTRFFDTFSTGEAFVEVAGFQMTGAGNSPSVCEVFFLVKLNTEVIDLFRKKTLLYTCVLIFFCLWFTTVLLLFVITQFPSILSLFIEF